MKMPNRIWLWRWMHRIAHLVINQRSCIEHLHVNLWIMVRFYEVRSPKMRTTKLVDRLHSMDLLWKRRKREKRRKENDSASAACLLIFSSSLRYFPLIFFFIFFFIAIVVGFQCLVFFFLLSSVSSLQIRYADETFRSREMKTNEKRMKTRVCVCAHFFKELFMKSASST